MTRGDIKKLQISEVNNVIVHVFPERITRHFDETLTIWIAKQIEMFS